MMRREAEEVEEEVNPPYLIHKLQRLSLSLSLLFSQ